jgi:cytochrome c556
MRDRLLGACVVSTLLTGFAVDAIAQAQPKPETMVQSRQSAMRLQWKYLSPLVQMARSRVPYDAAIAARNAGYVDVLLKMAWDDFTPATEGVKSRTLPVVYKEPDQFKAAQEAVQAEAAKLAATVKGGDEAAIKAGVLALNDACNNCHDKFREKQ